MIRILLIVALTILSCNSNQKNKVKNYQEDLERKT